MAVLRFVAIAVALASLARANVGQMQCGMVLEKAMLMRVQVGTCVGNPVPFFRLVSPYQGAGQGADEHMYTTSKTEANAAFPRYYSEPDCCKVFTNQTQSEDLVPLYRLYRPKWVYDHWYTTDAAERAAALATGLHIDEGIAAYVRTTEGCASTPLYRLYRFNGREGSEDHFYTISKKERDSAITNGGYNYEGIAAYVWANCREGLDFCTIPE